MNLAWLLIIGCSFFGWLIPEFLVAFSPKKAIAPLIMNVLSAVSAGFIAAYFSL